MPKLVHRKQNFRELGFIPLHTKVLQEIRTPCNKWGKWIYVVKLGFYRYRFVGYNYSVEQNISALPWTAVVRKGTNHICMNGKESLSRFRMNDDIKRNNGRIITRIQNHDQLDNRRQNNENRLCIANLQRQNHRHKLKSTLESI